MMKYQKEIIDKIVGMGLLVRVDGGAGALFDGDGGTALLVKVTGYRPGTADRGFEQGDPSEVQFEIQAAPTPEGADLSELYDDDRVYDAVREVVDAEFDRLLDKVFNKFNTTD